MIENGKCANCGGVQVAGSTSNEDYLLSLCEGRLITIERLEKEEKELVEKVEKLTALVNRLLDHITADMIGDGELYARLRESIVKPMKED